MSKRRNQPLSAPVLKALTAVLGLMALTAAAQVLVSSQQTQTAEFIKSPDNMSPVQLEPGDTVVTKEFASHLPLVVFDIGNAEPGAGAFWDEEKGYYAPAKEDPYAYGNLWVVDNKNGTNCLMDLPAQGGKVKIRLRGNSSLRFPKKQYLIKFIEENGEKEKQTILDMGAESDWILNISWQDPSLLRNYLAYTMGKKTLVETPDARFCEVVRKRESGYEYLGVYLIIETIKQGRDRVDIPKYRSNQTLSFILRRDRYDESEVMPDTYATGHGLSEGFLGIKYPDRDKISSEDVAKIEEKISAFEQALYSEDTEIFLTYKNYIDLPSFVDYFVFNELFMNYDAGFNSTYLYIDYTGRLKMGPFWDFDQCLANDTAYKSNLESTAFHSAPWFKQLLRDPNYVMELEKRYHELRAGEFSDTNLQFVMENARKYLGTAARRDWNRWQYEQAVPLNPYMAAPQSFEDASASLDKTLFIHARWLDDHIDSLYQFSDPSISLEQPGESAREKAERYGNVLAVTFIGAFLLSVYLLRREM